MKNKKILSLLLSLCIMLNVFAQTKPAAKAPVKTAAITYESAPNDPLNARIYTLANGMKVYMTVNKNEPRILTHIATRAGSKSDPADATGLAHYLEHMLFKGTDKYGTKDFAKEKPLLDSIENLYEVYRGTTDDVQRKTIYRKIDSLSGVAATYAIANEYDKMVASIGAKNSNAHTSFEETVYDCDIPSNQLEKWLMIEGERFRNPVLRIFHTELEAVYEEKNRSLDNDDFKVWEVLFEALYPNHNYGKQTTIGTIEHLKNPSLKKIEEYYNTYYVPNNMAIFLSGDLDPDATIKLVDKYFGYMKPKALPTYSAAALEPISAPVVKEVLGPEAESVAVAYRFGGAGTVDADLVKIIEKILFNGTAGLMDLNLNQKQLLLRSSVFAYELKEYTSLILMASPKQGQELEKCTNLMLEQIKLLKAGEFEDWLIPAIVNDIKLNDIKMFEENWGRGRTMVEAFIQEKTWAQQVSRIDRLSKITKEEVVAFANKYLLENYVVINKRTGEDKAVIKVVKPEITPVDVNRDDQSPFLKAITAKTVLPINPVFLDFKKDIQQLTLANKVPVYYTKNSLNQLFKLYYVVDMGTNHNKKLGMAMEYLKFLGTSHMKPEEVQQEFYKLGCILDVYASDDRVNVSIEGLSENFDKCLTLLETLLQDMQPNKTALDNLVSAAIKKREDAKLSKDRILWSAMDSYARYGKDSPFLYNLSHSQLRTLTPEELVSTAKNLFGYEHHILYYGPLPVETVISTLNTFHKSPAIIKPVYAPKKFVELNSDSNMVYVVDYDMKQAEVLMLSKRGTYDATIVPRARLFNEYFGGGMSSIVFQTMRESKALAYSVYSNFNITNDKMKSNFLIAYIGTQADKLPEAMVGMKSLLDTLPQSEVIFSSIKTSVLEQIRTERITKSDILWEFEKARKLGLDYDIRANVYAEVQKMGLKDITDFHNKEFASKNYNIMVLGNKSILDIKTLEKYGQVKYLTLKDIFGF